MVARRRPMLVTPDQARMLGFSTAELNRALRAAGQTKPLNNYAVRACLDPSKTAPLWLRRLRDERDMLDAKRLADHARKNAPKVRLFNVDLGSVEDKIFDGRAFTRDERLSFERIAEVALDKFVEGGLLSPLESAALRRAKTEGNLIWDAA